MNRDFFEANWAQIQDFIKARFNKLTDEDIRAIKGRYDELISRIEERYGWTKEQAETELRQLPERVRAAEPMPRKEEGASAFKWALAFGIPLLVLGALYMGSYRESVDPIPQPNEVVAEETTVFAINPGDMPIAQKIKEFVKENQSLIQDLKNLKFTADNGVITVKGTVENQQDKDKIGAILTKIPGVIRVDNQIDVRK